jgi:hypothetical protein
MDGRTPSFLEKEEFSKELPASLAAPSKVKEGGNGIS